MKTLFSTLIVFISLHASAQDSVLYVQGFAFQQGIYLSFQQFQSNSPVPKSAIISSEDSSRLDFIKLVLTKEYVEWKDSSGKIQKTKVSSLWGYSENKSVYVRHNNNFNRIVVIGKVCHFTAYVTDYMYTGPGTYPNQQYGTPVETLQQYILDTETGAIMDYNVATMESILKRDQELYTEFCNLRKRKKKEQLFIYLRKYNERHPLYFGNGD